MTAMSPGSEFVNSCDVDTRALLQGLVGRRDHRAHRGRRDPGLFGKATRC